MWHLYHVITYTTRHHALPKELVTDQGYRYGIPTTGARTTTPWHVDTGEFDVWSITTEYITSAQRQKGLPSYCFKYIDRPFCLQADNNVKVLLCLYSHILHLHLLSSGIWPEDCHDNCWKKLWGFFDACQALNLYTKSFFLFIVLKGQDHTTTQDRSQMY